MLRRRFLSMLAGGACSLPFAAPRRAAATTLPPVPRVNGGINVQPLRRLEPTPAAAQPVIVPELVDLQMRALYELGFEQMRITLSFNRFDANFVAAIPYVRAARALGIDVVGVMSDFAGYALVQALAQRRSRAAVLNTYRDIFVLPELEPAAPTLARAGGFALQVLNEPTHSLGLTPRDYVQEFLLPVNEFFKLRSPELLVASAAEVGNVEGIYRVRAMLEAGLEPACDRVAYHVYSRRLIPLLAGLTRRRVWITESGFDGTAGHAAWVRDGFAEMRRAIAGVERIFFYVLFDRAPGRFRMLDIVRDGPGAFRARAESAELIQHLLGRVARATAGAPTTPYEQLLPDITAYFPTPFDLDRIVEASPFLPPP